MANVSARNAGKVKMGTLLVNRIGLGTNRISDNEASRSVLKKAVELNIDYIDTADKYGLSEAIIGQTLNPYPPELVIGTKGGWSEQNEPTYLETRINTSLKLLKVEQIQLWQLHRIDPKVPIENTMTFLKKEMQKGKIINVGLSEVSLEQIKKARSIIPIASVQNRYNLIEREHEEVLDYCTAEKIIFMPFFPLNSGDAEYNKKLNKVANEYDASAIQIALAWLLKRSPIMLPIPGTLSTAHLIENVGAANIDLSDRDFEFLNY